MSSLINYRSIRDKFLFKKLEPSFAIIMNVILLTAMIVQNLSHNHEINNYYKGSKEDP